MESTAIQSVLNKKRFNLKLFKCCWKITVTVSHSEFCCTPKLKLHHVNVGSNYQINLIYYNRNKIVSFRQKCTFGYCWSQKEFLFFYLQFWRVNMYPCFYPLFIFTDVKWSAQKWLHLNPQKFKFIQNLERKSLKTHSTGKTTR